MLKENFKVAVPEFPDISLQSIPAHLPRHSRKSSWLF